MVLIIYVLHIFSCIALIKNNKINSQHFINFLHITDRFFHSTDSRDSNFDDGLGSEMIVYYAWTNISKFHIDL